MQHARLSIHCHADRLLANSCDYVFPAYLLWKIVLGWIYLCNYHFLFYSRNKLTILHIVGGTTWFTPNAIVSWISLYRYICVSQFIAPILLSWNQI